ncbi:MAG: polysaccharide deacetylase family protein [Syntrophomonadaceae bacterium]
MRLYYFTWKRMGITAIAAIFLCLAAGLIFRHPGPGVMSSSAKAIYQGSTGEKAVAITVNVDWGGEYIPAMLEAFQKYNARVTFFVTGKWAENNPELMKAMSAANHSIQNHGYQHVHFNQLSAAQIEEQIKQAEDVIFAATGKKSRYFAPPYGEKNSPLVATVNRIGYQYIMWSVDTIDWQKPAPQIITQRVMKKVHNDAIILMHPTEPTVKALPEILAGLSAQGYKMLGIDELLPETGEQSQ